MSLFVSILKYPNRGTRCYALSCASTKDRTVADSTFWVKKNASQDGGVVDVRIVELAIPEDKYREFCKTLSTYDTIEKINAFHTLNDKYKQEALKLMPPAAGAKASPAVGKKEEFKGRPEFDSIVFN